jgi:Ca-activated chloride channel homolog
MKRVLRGTPILAGLLLGASLLATAAPAPAPLESVTLSGTVRDARTGAPLPNATVAVVGTRIGTVTGPAGSFRLRVPRAGLDRVLTVRVSLIGYAAAEHTVDTSVAETVLDVRLHARAVQMEGVVVAGYDTRSRTPLMLRQAAAEAAHAPVPGYPRWNTESYDRIADNDFIAVAQRPLSTFSADVDRASYSNVRRFLTSGERPPRDAVRIEEMVNYFAYDYPEPSGEHPFSVTLQVGPAPWKPGHRLLRIGLQTRRLAMAELPPNNLVFLIDVSGSMYTPDRLPLAKQSLRLLVEQLRPQDRVAIVVYAGAAGLVLPSVAGSEKATILDAIERLEAGGSTAGGAGLKLAYEVARENHIRGGNNRVVLATDGDFNVGVSSDGEMVRLIESKRAQGTFLTILGFGRGNLKDSKMEKLAGHGNGNYAYIDNLMEARKALVTELGATLLTVAKDVKLQVEFNPAHVLAYRLIGYENRLLADEDFNDDSRDAGDMGAGHSVTALYELIPAGARSDVQVRGVDPLRYQAPTTRSARGGEELASVKVRYKAPDGDRSRLLERSVIAREAQTGDLGFVAAVAGFGMLLRESEHRGDLTLDRVVAIARANRGPDESGERAEFIRLVELFRASASANAVRGSETAGW